MSNSEPHTLPVAEVARRTGEHEETIRRKIRTGEIFARKTGVGPKAPWGVSEADVTRYIARRDHERRMRESGIVVAYADEEFDAKMEKTHGRDATEQVRAIRQRRDLLEEAARAVAADPDLRRAFEQLDDDQIIERTAQEIANRVRREERIRRRAAQILADDDEHDA